MINSIVIVALGIISISMLLLIYRVVKGPSVPDRVVALDALGINLVGVVALISIVFNSFAFLEVILLIGILAFIGTIAFAKFLEKGVIIERDRDS
ncbi:monovalent cation/H+ antiporter subunit F [Bacillus coahuilensis p1.1.43]|uniref:Monovalent cation/H+ antiporter subunit F n=1 Tax=Bacillus coahuilensis p1.1.43 TaxID=1150625 RepID=A0A147K687_9BACI|nr:Na(+)/H(+) antiporter subunit F1 [Bacillus coahuilensis]KUP05352.1 monovalent cation/H+ antiporter subunit F [Bacillus coahuilensis p1.1.43]